MFCQIQLPNWLPLFLAMSHMTNATPQPSRSSRGTLKFSYAPNITRVTIDHPPINLGDAELVGDLYDFMNSIQPSASRIPPPKVVIFDSADPEIFLSHIDLNEFFSSNSAGYFAQLGGITAMLRNTTTTAFISEINGMATGFGNEFLIQTDMRYAGPKTRASQLENAGGVIVSEGGLQALPRLINRGRGLQYLLASDAIDGPTGAAFGWFNEYHRESKTLRRAVDRIAKRIALFPSGSLNATKASLGELYPAPKVYDRDQESIVRLGSGPAEQAMFKRILKASNNHSRNAFELGLPDTLLTLY